MDENTTLRRKYYAPRQSLFFTRSCLAHNPPLSSKGFFAKDRQHWRHWLFEAKK